MPRVLFLAAPAFMIACSSSPPPAASLPPQPSPAAIAQQAEQESAQRSADSRARDQALYDESMQAHAAQVASVEKAEADRKEAGRKPCDDSREERVAHDKAMVSARLDVGIRLLKNAKAIRAACKIVDRKTGAANVSRSGSGWRVSPEMADDVKCSGALPAGVSKDDAYVVLWHDRAGAKLFDGPMLESDDHAPLDAACAAVDATVGLDTSAPHWGDDASIDKLVKWRAPSVTPPSSR